METVEQGIGSIQVTENDIVSHATDLFSPIISEISMIDGGETVYRPLSKENAGPFTFIIPSLGTKFIALHLTRLYLKLKVVQHDGTALKDNDVVSLTNLVGGSFQNSVNIKIDGEEIPGLGNTFMHYKQYVETNLSYGFSPTKSHLTTSRFELDSAGKFEDMTANSANDGFKKRRQWIEKSKTFEVMCPIHSDFLQTDRLFPPGHEITFTITRNPDSFVLLSTLGAAKKYRLEVEEIFLHVRHVTLTSDVTTNLLARLQKETMIFPMNKSVLYRFAFSSGLTTASIPNLINGSLPKNIIFFMTEEKSDDVYDKNPYNFQHFNMQSMCIRVNGKEYPSEKYNFHMKNGLYMRLLRDFYDNIGIVHNNTGIHINYEKFNKGYLFIPFDLSPDLCNGYHTHFKKKGTIQAEFTFRESLENPIAIYALANYDATLYIKRKRTPVLEY